MLLPVLRVVTRTATLRTKTPMKASLQLPKGWFKLQRYERIKAGDRPMYGDGSVSKHRLKKNAPEVGMTVAASGWFNVARLRGHSNKPVNRACAGEG